MEDEQRAQLDKLGVTVFNNDFVVPEDVKQVLVTDLLKDGGRIFVCDSRFITGLKPDGTKWWHVEVHDAATAALRLDELGWRMSVEAGAWVRKTERNISIFQVNQPIMLEVGRVDIRETRMEDRIRFTCMVAGMQSTVFVVVPPRHGKKWLQEVTGLAQLRSEGEKEP